MFDVTVAYQLTMLAAAGAVGTLARFGLGLLASRLCGTSFPWATLIINFLGCLLFGWVWSLAIERKVISEADRVIVLTGFMGAFTTFSTFAFETADRLKQGDWWIAALNISAQNVLGVLAIFLGMALARIV